MWHIASESTSHVKHSSPKGFKILTLSTLEETRSAVSTARLSDELRTAMKVSPPAPVDFSTASSSGLPPSSTCRNFDLPLLLPFFSFSKLAFLSKAVDNPWQCDPSGHSATLHQLLQSRLRWFESLPLASSTDLDSKTSLVHDLCHCYDHLATISARSASLCRLHATYSFSAAILLACLAADAPH